MTRAVLDANTHVSAALVPYGYPAKIIQAWRDGKFVSISSIAILEEVAEVLKRSHIQKKYKGVNEETIQALVEYTLEFAVITPGQLKVEAVPNDPDDNKIIACAIEGEAAYIVTGDPHLKDLKSYRGIQIVSPKEFWPLEFSSKISGAGPLNFLRKFQGVALEFVLSWFNYLWNNFAILRWLFGLGLEKRKELGVAGTKAGSCLLTKFYLYVRFPYSKEIKNQF